MRKSREVLPVVSTILALPMSAYAQASIAGVVKDTSGAVLPQARFFKVSAQIDF
jgi:hypothetical protein